MQKCGKFKKFAKDVWMCDTCFAEPRPKLCIGCGEDPNKSQEVVQCDEGIGCGRWFHWKCWVQDLEAVISDYADDDVWLCPWCLRARA